MQHVEFARRQNAEKLLNCMFHALTFFRRCAADSADRQHELGGPGPGRRPAALTCEAAGLCQLLGLRPARLSSVQAVRSPLEELTPLEGQPAYDTAGRVSRQLLRVQSALARASSAGKNVGSPSQSTARAPGKDDQNAE